MSSPHETPRQPPSLWPLRGVPHMVIHLKGRRPVSAPTAVPSTRDKEDDPPVLRKSDTASASTAAVRGDVVVRDNDRRVGAGATDTFHCAQPPSTESTSRTLLTPARPTSSRPSTAGRSALSCSDRMSQATARTVVTTTKSSPRCIDMVLKPMEASLTDLDPQTLYLHAHVFQFSGGLLADLSDPDVQRIALAAASPSAAGSSLNNPATRTVSSVSSSIREGKDCAASLRDRVHRSEERIVKRRAAAGTHARGGHTAKNDPSSLNLLVARLCGSGSAGARLGSDALQGTERNATARSLAPPSLDADDGLSAGCEASLRSWDPVEPRVDGGEDAPTRRGVPAAYHDSACTAAATAAHGQRHSQRGTSISSHEGTALVPLSTTEAAVHQRLLDRIEILKGEQIAARTDARRSELAESIHRYERLAQNCHSALRHLNVAHATTPPSSYTAGEHSRVMSWPVLRQRLQLDDLTPDQLDARLTYGEVARHIREEVQQARRVQWKRSMEHEQPLPAEVRHAFAKKRRTHERTSLEHLLRERQGHWEERARAARTLGFVERIEECARQEVERRKYLWRAVVLMHRYPRELLARRAVVLQRILVSKKKKEEHVAHFLWLMRRCLARRRRRICQRLWTSAYAAFRFLRLFVSVRARRAAIGHIVEWFQERRRRRPMPVIVHSFLNTIQTCQRMSRQLVSRRRLETCWLLALSFRLPEAPLRWAPQRNGFVRRRGPDAGPGQTPAAPLSGSAVLRVVLERFLDDVVPPFGIRLAVAERLVRRRAQVYADAVHECQKRRKLLRMLQLRGITTLPDGSSTVKMPPWPHHAVMPSLEMLQTFLGECTSEFRLWITRGVTEVLSNILPETTSDSAMSEPVRVDDLVMTKLSTSLKQAEEFAFVRHWAPWMLVTPFGGDAAAAAGTVSQQSQHTSRPLQRGAGPGASGARRRSGSTVDRRREAPRRLSERKSMANALDSSVTSQDDRSGRSTLEAMILYQKVLKQSTSKPA